MKDYGQFVKSLAKVYGKDVMQDIKLKKNRKKRAKETTPRNQPERELRKEVINYLKCEGCVVKRIENSISGKNIGNSIPDLWVFYEPTQWGGWIELKAPGKDLYDKGQIHFRDMCLTTNVNHLVVRSIDELQPIFIKRG